MIDYETTRVGDILRITRELSGVSGKAFGAIGDLVRVLKANFNSVLVENRHGTQAEFVFNCGAAKLELTEWRDDFPVEAAVGGSINTLGEE